MLQGPCRALLADLSGDNQRLTRFSNSLFSFFMGAGNILGYLVGAQDGLYKIFKFSHTPAMTFYEKLWSPEANEGRLESDDVNETEKNDVGGLTSFLRALKSLDMPMWMLLLLTCLNWFAWFPWVLYNTDWMGREVYGGDSGMNSGQIQMYDRGVRAGSIGLMINSIVLLIVSLAIDPLARKLGAKFMWGGVNLILGICLAMIVVISKAAESERRHGGGGYTGPSSGIKSASLAVFGILGLPLAVMYNIPFAMVSIYSQGSGAGQWFSR
ncbi:Sucrose transport protein SUC2 [Linum perenne]